MHFIVLYLWSMIRPSFTLVHPHNILYLCGNSIQGFYLLYLLFVIVPPEVFYESYCRCYSICRSVNQKCTFNKTPPQQLKNNAEQQHKRSSMGGASSNISEPTPPPPLLLLTITPVIHTQRPEHESIHPQHQQNHSCIDIYGRPKLSFDPFGCCSALPGMESGCGPRRKQCECLSDCIRIII